jgi:cyclopropane fatty-acyl-phospholipid synthase-like methyltransferase
VVKAAAVIDRVRNLGQTLLRPQTREKLEAWWHGAESLDAPLEGAPDTSADEAPQPEIQPGSTILQRIRVAEALWGHGNFGPGDAEFLTALAAQLGLTKEMSIAFIGVGLGGAARALVDDTEVWIAGYEANPTIAAIGVEQCTIAGKAKKVAISVVDYETLALPAKKFNDVISKETLYLVKDKARLLGQIASHMKPGGTILFTDYVAPAGALSAQERDQLFASELGEAMPISPTEYAKLMTDVGLDVRVNEDISGSFGEFVTQGWANLRRMLDQLAANEPNPAERALFMRIVAEEAAHWGNRLEAFRTGRLAVHRFVALKPGEVA